MKINHEFYIVDTKPRINVDNKEIGDVIGELKDKAGVWIDKSKSKVYMTIDGVNKGENVLISLNKCDVVKQNLEGTINTYVLEGREKYPNTFTLTLENYDTEGEPPANYWAALNRNIQHYGIKCTIEYEGNFGGEEIIKNLHEALKEIYNPPKKEIRLKGPDYFKNFFNNL